MVKDLLWPGQLLTGVTVMVAVIAAVPLLTAVKLPMLPLPLATNPIEGWLFDQVKLVPANVLLKVNGPTVCPAQTTTLAGTVTSGEGFTVNGLLTVVVPQSLVTARLTV